MALHPIYEQNASEEVADSYSKIKKALAISKVPLFFTFLGNFPKYLVYITNQIISNLQNPAFSNLLSESSDKTKDLLSANLTKSDELLDFILRYKNASYFYNFQRDLESIFSTNMKLVFVFISLREALKGWALAAKKIGPQANVSHETTLNNMIKKEDFIFDPASDMEKTQEQTYIRIRKQTVEGALVKHQAPALEVDLLPKYLWLCRREFIDILKTDGFWVLRVGIEKSFLSYLEFLPSLIFSPVNIVLNLTENNPDYPDLLYLLSEQFPTLAVQRLIFSGYMMA